MCGIAGIISKTKRPFDFSTFCTLGIANDSRGGDSCGVFIDGKYEYGVDKKRYFQDFFYDSKLVTTVEESTIALLHCRKASIGNISKETAQPVVLTDKKGNIRYVLIHNGTIYNYKELAEKYIPRVNIKGLTDSQVMARIFYYTGYDALDEYIGGSVFAAIDYREENPKTYIFKGCSKKYKGSVSKEVERPLYYTFDKETKELVFSSIGIYLMALRPYEYTLPVPENKLLEFTDTGLVPKKYYSRDKVTQNKPVQITSYCSNFNCGYNTSSVKNISYNKYITLIDGDMYHVSGKPLEGKHTITKWGMIDVANGPDNIEVFFFYGVIMANEKCMNFLNDFRKESKLSDEAFFKKFESVVRYLSIDGIFKEADRYYISIAPFGKELFNGDFHELGAITVRHCSFGKVVNTTYGGDSKYFKKCLKNPVEFNLLEIKKECESMMK